MVKGEKWVSSEQQQNLSLQFRLMAEVFAKVRKIRHTVLQLDFYLSAVDLLNKPLISAKFGTSCPHRLRG